ncbi:hypothetical protein GCM10029992_36320 [Glycomyces albus]
MEIDLDAEDLTNLTAAAPVPPPNVGIAFHLRAQNHHDLGADRFTLVVEGAGRNVGTTEGRFLHLLDKTDRQRITEAWAQLPTTVADARRVQLSGPPLYVSTANVGRVPQALPDLLALGEYPANSPETIGLDDLAVTADLDGLRLVNLADGRTVEPVVPNAIEPTTRLHPLQRFLAGLPRARASVYTMLDWGMAASLPILPRLRSGRSVLAVARWKIAATRLPGKDRPWAEWTATWERLRHARRIPARVYLGDSDVRVRIELDDDAHLTLLRDEIDRTGTATLREAPTDADFGWIGGRAHEITLPWPPKASQNLHRSAPRVPTRSPSPKATICPEPGGGCTPSSTPTQAGSTTCSSITCPSCSPRGISPRHGGSSATETPAPTCDCASASPRRPGTAPQASTSASGPPICVVAG